MSDAKHTPGPWFQENDDDDDIFISAETRVGMVGICTVAVGYDDPFDAEQRANARLIAAAPDLLEALKDALGAANELELSSAHFPRPEIEAAIAKAEGRS